MGQLLLFIVVALVVGAIVFGVTVLFGGGDSGLTPVEPDGAATPLPSDRPLGEDDVTRTRFDTSFRGYRMDQVDQALQRAAYDIGYKGELIGVLEAEVTALREGRLTDADTLRRAREAAVAPTAKAEPTAAVPTDGGPAEADSAKAELVNAGSVKGEPASAESASAAPANAAPANAVSLAEASPSPSAAPPASPALAAETNGGGKESEPVERR